MNEAAGDAADGRPHSGFNYNANVGSNEDGGRFVPPTHPEASSVETNANAMVEGSIRADYDAAHSFAASHDSFSRRQTTEGSGAAAEGHSEAPAGGGSSETGNSAPEAPLRKGKWTAEEVAYTTAIIADFSSGYVVLCPFMHCAHFLSFPRFNLDLWPLAFVIPNSESLHYLRLLVLVCLFAFKVYQCKVTHSS
jgi:hypothetical protein